MTDKKFKILFLPEWYPNHLDPQLGVFVEKHARAASLFHDIAVIYVYPAPVRETKIETRKENGFYLIRVCYPAKKNLFAAYTAYLNAQKTAVKILEDEWGTPQLVHLHMLYRNYLAWEKIWKPKNIRFMLTEQWSGYLNGNYEKLPFYKRRYFKKAFTNALAITAVSKRLADELTKKFSTGQIHIVPNIAERQERTPEITQRPLRLLLVGDLVDKVKNISGVIRAYASAKIKQESELHIIGDGIDAGALKNLANKIQGNKKVKFHGRLTNDAVLQYMNQSDFLITNSYFETFSMVTAEALLSGLPVICTRCGGPEEFVNDTNGILIPVENDALLQDAIEKMSVQYKSYTPQRLANPVIQRFGLEAVGQQLSRIYHKIILP